MSDFTDVDDVHVGVGDDVPPSSAGAGAGGANAAAVPGDAPASSAAAMAGMEDDATAMGHPALLKHGSDDSYLFLPIATLREGDVSGSTHLTPFVILVDVSGSMKSVPKTVLSASLYRLLAFAAVQGALCTTVCSALSLSLSTLDT